MLVLEAPDPAAIAPAATRIITVTEGGRVFRVAQYSIEGVWTVQELDGEGQPLVIRRPLYGQDPSSDLSWLLGFGTISFSLESALASIQEQFR